MQAVVPVPLWLFVLIIAFALIAFFSHFLFPSVRWFLRRRMEKAVARLNARLTRPIEPFRLMRRQDTITRLIYDPAVAEAVVAHARENAMPESVAFAEAHRYAREIVPGFSAFAYFGLAIRAARGLSRLLYRVRLGHFDAAAIEAIDPGATVIFVMNHRSNMDYVLVTYLAAERSALSYAVGEWARVWPLSRLIRSMGAYFIRRRSRSPLYRRVLARYVQMATAEGVTQAIFPEGGLSLDGRVGAARLGLLNYIVTGFRPGEGRDVVFIPVALNYDRVLEDRVLIAAAVAGERRFRARPATIFAFILRHLWQKLRGRFDRFGYAAVSFGSPLSLAAFVTAHPGADPTEALAGALMARIRKVVPVLPVPLVAAVLRAAAGPLDAAALTARAEGLLARLADVGAHVHLPRGGIAAATASGAGALLRRRVVMQTGDRITAAPEQAALLAFYAASIDQLLDADAAETAGLLAENVTTKT